MKDFYDLRYLSRRFAFEWAPTPRGDSCDLRSAANRIGRAALPVYLRICKPAPEKATQWSSFLDRNGLSGTMPNFSDVMIELREFIQPALGTPPGNGAPKAGGSSKRRDIYAMVRSNFFLSYARNHHPHSGNPSYSRLKKVAKGDGISINEFFVTAAAEKLAALDTEISLRNEAAKGSASRGLKTLAQAP